MNTLLFYVKPAPLNSEVHQQLRIKDPGSLDFAKSTNSLPLAAIEFFDCAREYPVVFTGKEGGPVFPIALTGVRKDENLFVNEKGEWDARYIPAFVRRYPFVLAEKQEAQDFNVYIDEAFAGFNTTEGERLFNDDRTPSTLLSQALEFLSTYQGEIVRTRELVDRLTALDLLVPRVLEVVRQGEAPIVLQGFSVVDEQRLGQLADADLLSLVKSGHLAWIYAHLMSLANVAGLSERLQARLLAAAAPKEEAAPAPAPAPEGGKKKRG